MLCAIALLVALGASICLPSASALGDTHFRKRDPLQPRQTNSTTAPAYSTEYYFDQLIDHANPAAGTFKQRYFFSDQYYKGQGSPIVIGTPGEQSADGFYTDLTGLSMMHAMLDVWGAAGVVIEHRYWGKSSPYSTLTAPNLQYLTVNQAIDDYKYFVENVKLPWASGSYSSVPTATPWVNIGCSYPGLLVAYTQEKYPDLFAAGYATSAPVNADGDFWEYWEPIEEGMPQNCSADLAAAMDYMDNIMATGTPDQVIALKTQFGMEALENDDFGAALQNPINTWQDLQAATFSLKGTSLFFQFCDAIETNADGTQNMNPQGVGMPQALTNWAKTFKALGPDENCPNTGGACYSTQNPNSQMYTNTTVTDDYARGWIWLLCTQLGFFQVGDPGNSSSIVSSQVTTAYAQRQCSYYFPLADGTHSTYNFSAPVDSLNTQFKGWNVVGSNLYVVNGEFDPWRSASVSSTWAPSFVDTPTQEVTVIPDAHHCWDYYLMNTQVNDDVKAVQNKGLIQIHDWLQTWYTNHPGVTNNLPALASTAGEMNPVGETLNNINGTNDTILNDLKDKVNELAANKKLVMISWGLNAVFLVALIVVVILLIRAKRALAAVNKSAPVGSSIPMARWSLSKGAAPPGEQTGKRGTYQHIQDQTP
ncbi:hypothetical protein M407DRAFT_28564 [Tulasnella calospora MUT 4182]|uniref:Peptidase S28 n=1 Tax=Tulasnella calospora MUT 4182 TaxID=1051891 RepID=A0A0C3KKD7_9AGAM|nr:hypothetical protein M407DRAFT_28564 [Tulasnella calospora MUT 4182]